FGFVTRQRRASKNLSRSPLRSCTSPAVHALRPLSTPSSLARRSSAQRSRRRLRPPVPSAQSCPTLSHEHLQPPSLPAPPPLPEIRGVLGSSRVDGRLLLIWRDRVVARPPGMNARPVVLVFLLLVLVITSQFEWKQQIGDAADADPAAARRRQQLLGRDDAVKEKLIESLQRQLLHCRGSNNTVHTTTIAATEVSEVEGHEIIDDDNL
ncbi:hypothetical protein EJB05_56609, partial [Eragrostis curvula]